MLVASSAAPRASSSCFSMENIGLFDVTFRPNDLLQTPTSGSIPSMKDEGLSNRRRQTPAFDHASLLHFAFYMSSSTSIDHHPHGRLRSQLYPPRGGVGRRCGGVGRRRSVRSVGVLCLGGVFCRCRPTPTPARNFETSFSVSSKRELSPNGSSTMNSSGEIEEMPASPEEATEPNRRQRFRCFI